MLDASKNRNWGKDGATASSSISAQNAFSTKGLVRNFFLLFSMMDFVAVLFSQHQCALYIIIVKDTK